MRLPATDLGIMAEHLATHEGVINKLKIYYATVRNSALRNLLHTHLQVLRNHVRAMLILIDPNQQGPYHLHEMEDVHLNFGNEQFSEQEKDITLEARATAKLMSSNNFMSALMMNDANVKHVHIEMALQEVRLQSLYSEIVHHINGDFTPKVTEKMQLLTMQKYYHVLGE
ncbi:hypothetical protein ERJ70_06960 [Sediminibacillus dalangtanensis]|uniref:Uncharacterized protein n=1 Tax=Sediminibacillus dalangtanensis TaxID=2729421 RepID=A0ABX7VRC5_9BACI|nr:hypothetical protein [Sediminibacillus dalangtanensis]QTM99063.1 hypothetical protein ERJ70_06960 [Sediminibacillus dalangtanensis]